MEKYINSTHSTIRRILSNTSGYTLYLVIIVLSISGILFTITINSIQSIQKLVAREGIRLQCRALAQSGIKRAEYFFNGNDNHDMNWTTNGFDEQIEGCGTIHIECAPFGVYSRIVSAGSRINHTATITAMAGRNLPEILQPALTLTGHIGGLVIDDKTTLEGEIILHHGYVMRNKAVYYDGSTIQKAMPGLPFDIMPVKKTMDSLKNLIKAKAPTISNNIVINRTNDTLLKMYQTLVIAGNCTIDSLPIADKTILVDGKLTLNSCRSSNSVFTAESLLSITDTSQYCIFYTTGTQVLHSGLHASQFFAYDSIVVQSAVKTLPPTIWVSYRECKNDTFPHGGIFFAPQGTYNGIALTYADSTIPCSFGAPMRPAITVGEGSVFFGTIISDGAVTISNTSIGGHVWANSVISIKDKMFYTNYLFNTIIMSTTTEQPFLLLGAKPITVTTAIINETFK